MTSIGVTIHFNNMCREDFKEERIAKGIKQICNNENVYCAIGYDEQTPIQDMERISKITEGVCVNCGMEVVEGHFFCSDKCKEEAHMINPDDLKPCSCKDGEDEIQDFKCYKCGGKATEKQIMEIVNDPRNDN